MSPALVKAFYNLPLLHTEGSLRKRKSRPQASLTATHSSTLAEEIVSVLRILHSLGQWNSLINDYINAQLSSIGDVMAGCQSEAVRTVYSYSVDMLIHIGSFYCQAVFNKTVLSKMSYVTVSVLA